MKRKVERKRKSEKEIKTFKKKGKMKEMNIEV